MSARLEESVRKAKKRGVKLRVIGMERPDIKSLFKLKKYRDLGADIRIYETKVHPRIVISDSREMLMRLDHDTKMKQGFRFNSLWSQDPSMIKVMDTYVKNLWNSSERMSLRDIEPG